MAKEPTKQTSDEITKDLKPEDIAKMRAEMEAKAKSGDVDLAYCPATGLRYVIKTGLVPMKFSVGIPEMNPGVNKGETRGCLPAQAKHLKAKGYADYVLDNPVQS